MWLIHWDHALEKIEKGKNKTSSNNSIDIYIKTKKNK